MKCKRPIPTQYPANREIAFFVKPDKPHILFVNPWIHDFAAYDFWAKPLGLLTLAALLRQHGLEVSYMDCLDRFHPRARPTDPYARYGRGPYLKTRIEKPAGLHDVPRHYSRYGIPADWFREDLNCLGKPDLICVTSQMTYWYPGLRETIARLKALFPATPVILGGVYASLCRSHAEKYAGADRVVTGPGETQILKLVSELTGFAVRPLFEPDDLDTYPYPAFDLQRKITYVPLLSAKGCPYDCAYCASSILQPRRILRDPLAIVDEIQYWHRARGVREFVFYDDALLVNANRHALPMLEQIIRAGLNVRFHTPNAIHIRGLSPLAARLMFAAGFKTLRLGLETALFESRKELDRKVTRREFLRAVEALKAAGFEKDQVGAYLLVGLPGQSREAIADSFETVRESGLSPVPAYYSPIPQTALWEQAVASSRYDLNADPIFTNNAIFPCQKEGFSWETVAFIKGQVSGQTDDLSV